MGIVITFSRHKYVQRRHSHIRSLQFGTRFWILMRFDFAPIYSEHERLLYIWAQAVCLSLEVRLLLAEC